MLTRGACRRGSTELSQPTDAAEISISGSQAAGISAMVSEPTQTEAGLLGALRAACSLANVKYTEAMPANDLLIELLAKRDPSMLPQPSEHDHIRPASIGGSVSTNILKEGHKFLGNDIVSDPLLELLYNARRDACALGSVRQAIPNVTRCPTLESVENAKLAAINIGDVVRYREQGAKDTVLAAVIGITSKRARGTGVVVTIQARRLYEYKEILGILDSIAPYRRNPKLQGVILSARNTATSSEEDGDLKSAKEQFQALKELLKQHLRSADTGPPHSVLMTFLSDHDVFLTPDKVYSVLHATVNPAIFEKIDENPKADPDWPPPDSVQRMHGGITVMWNAFVNTKTWTLHRIVLSEMGMIQQVLSFAGRALYWAPRIVMLGFAGIFRRTVLARMRDFGKHGGERHQFSVHIPCSFAYFAHLLQSTRKYVGGVIEETTGLDLSWDETKREWKAQWSSPDLLDVQLGRNWGNCCMEHRIVQVSGPVVARYCHKQPDKVHVIFTRVTLAANGGMSVDVDVPADYQHGVDAGF